MAFLLAGPTPLQIVRKDAGPRKPSWLGLGDRLNSRRRCNRSQFEPSETAVGGSDRRTRRLPSIALELALADPTR